MLSYNVAAMQRANNHNKPLNITIIDVKYSSKYQTVPEWEECVRFFEKSFCLTSFTAA